MVGIRVGFTFANGPADFRAGVETDLPGFIPPTIQSTNISDAVGLSFHAAGAAGFLRTERCVEPDVAALDLAAGDGDIVVFEKNKPATKFWASSEIDDGFDELLAVIIARMGFASEDDLNRTLRIIEDAGETLGVAEEKGGAFVGSETASETDGERLGHENFFGFIDGGLGSTTIFELSLETAARKADQPFATAFGSAPEFASGDGLGALPEFGVGRLFAPFGAEIAVVELIHFERNPTVEVDTVGDMTNGNFGFGQTRPDGIPHAAADGTVQFADGIAIAGESKGEDGHAKIFVVGIGILAAEREEIAAADAEAVIEGGEVVIHEAGGKIVVSCRYGRVGGKDQTERGEDAGFGERELLRLHERANAFEVKECRVALVHVVDGRAQAESGECADATDAEQNFLLDAHIEIAAIELRGDGAVVWAIDGQIAIEKIDSDAANGNAPDARGNFTAG